MGRVGTLETAIIDGGNMDAEDEVIVAEEVASVVEGITGGGGGVGGEARSGQCRRAGYGGEVKW